MPVKKKNSNKPEKNGLNLKGSKFQLIIDKSIFDEEDDDLLHFRIHDNYSEISDITDKATLSEMSDAKVTTKKTSKRKIPIKVKLESEENLLGKRKYVKT